MEKCHENGSAQFSRSVTSDSLQAHELQHARPLCLSPTPGAYPNSCSLSRWCHPTVSSSVIPFSSCSQSFPASRFLQMSQLFASGGQSIGVSASTSVLPMNTQDWLVIINYFHTISPLLPKNSSIKEGKISSTWKDVTWSLRDMVFLLGFWINWDGG